MPRYIKPYLQTHSKFLQLPIAIRNRIYFHTLPSNQRIDSFATRYTSGFRNPVSVKRLRLTCRLINEEALAFYCSNNDFVLLVNYGNNINYPRDAYIRALEHMRYLKFVRNLVVEIVVGHRPAGAGYRYDTRETKRYLDIIFDRLEQAKEGTRGTLLDKLTLLDHSARVPSLMRQYAEDTGRELDEETLYKPLVDLVQGRDVDRLLIESDDGRLYTVDNL